MKILVAAWLWMMTVGLCLVKGNLQHGLITTTISIPYSHILHPMLILFLIKLFQFNLPHTSSIILKLISYFQLTMSIQNPIILQGASLNKQAKRRREPRGLTSHLTMISGRERLWRTSRTIFIVNLSFSNRLPGEVKLRSSQWPQRDSDSCFVSRWAGELYL